MKVCYTDEKFKKAKYEDKYFQLIKGLIEKNG